jgi:beta-lactam-binding protein with PASTA domain/tRNA A-37 threonylcarbamoyl transferase component Bud32
MDTTLSDPVVDRLLDGRYAVGARIARGGMASVYLAMDTRLDRRVAVKVMHPALAEDPDFVARFNREARTAAALSHPDVVAVYDQGNDDGHAFLVMEYVPGATLRVLLRERGRLTPAEAVAVMDHVLAALGAAHGAGLVHRDIKPENVLITADGRVKVADFGLARAVAGSNVTGADAAVLGTPAYVAPEQLQGGTADARTDVYTAGIMLFELLTGRPPYSGDAGAIVAKRHVDEDVPAPSSLIADVPDEIDALVLAATARDPDERPRDARALHASLIAIRDRLGLHGAVPALPDSVLSSTADAAGDTLVVERSGIAAPAGSGGWDPGQPATAARRRRKGPIILALVVVAALLAAFGGWYLAVGRYTAAPGVIDLGRSAALARLHKAGLHARWLPAVYSDTVGVGLVAQETPRPGHDVRRGGTVTLALSRGPEIHPVPGVRGDTVAAATATLAALHLPVGGTTTEYSSMRKGLVLGTDPPTGQSVRAGTPVTLIVSKGAEPVTVPDVTGKPVNDATSTLTALGLHVTTQGKYDDTVPAGNVIASTPPAGAAAHKGDTVNLVVSRGPELFPVPDVTGMPIGRAIQIIEKAGFTADPRRAFRGGPGNVFRENPTGKQPKGTTIELDYF